MGHGEKILIIDDSEVQREIAAQILKKLNYRVDIVDCGEEAVSYLQSYEADLLILDMIMEPGIDGLQTYLKIARFRPEQKLIIASGYSETVRVLEIQKLSGCQYIGKPYSIECLGRAAKSSLKES